MDEFKSLYIFYISGTGNARTSSEWFADEARRRGIKTFVQQIDRLENIVIPKPGEKPLIGFAFPTHGFNAAPIMLRFIAGFPSGICDRVFLMNTRAGMKIYKLFMPGLSGVALLFPAFILRIKGYNCIGFRPVDMPSNWIPLHPGLRKNVIESIIIRCEKIVRDFAAKILSGKKIYKGLFSIPVDLLISPLALAYYVGGRFFLSKTFIANYNCNNCGLCIKECPTSSIKLVGDRPYWKLSCESCMRCLNHCPEKAIEAAHGMAIAFWIIYSAINAQIILFLIYILNIPEEALWWKFVSMIIGIGGMIVITAVLYRFMHAAMQFSPVKYLVRFTSFTAMPFWRRYRYLKRNNNKTSREQGIQTN